MLPLVELEELVPVALVELELEEPAPVAPVELELEEPAPVAPVELELEEPAAVAPVLIAVPDAVGAEELEPAPVAPVGAQDRVMPCMIPSRGCVARVGAQNPALREAPAPVIPVDALPLEVPAPVLPVDAELAPEPAPVWFDGAQLVRLIPCMMPSRGCVALVGAHARASRDVPAPVWALTVQTVPSPCMIPSRGCVDLAGAQADAERV